ncbi:MAG: arginine--tRNA ligase [Candidatus Caenarcaniphilales bacterium]|nr:arginine--tRNA ligase [Candidatus Caenarcaniphilales bacterium]
MLKDKIINLFKDAIKKALDAGELGQLTEVPNEIDLDKCKNPDHGDRAISIAMKLARDAKMAPIKIAEAIVKYLDYKSIGSVTVVPPGFINIIFDWNCLEGSLVEIHREKENFGYFDKTKKEKNKILVEYVSANPTGNLHLGHGRQAALGSALASLLDWAGYDVFSEFYINDAGVQIEKLSASAKAAIQIQEGVIPESEYPEEAYPLESMLDVLKPEVYSEKLQAELDSDSNLKTKVDYKTLDAELAGKIAKDLFIDLQTKVLGDMEVRFDNWFSEKENLHQEKDNKVTEICKILEDNGNLYDQDSALWFKAKHYGDERDRVIQKSQGVYTYLAADIAYHKNKFDRGFDKLINIWGGDHHGQEPGIRGAIKAINYDPDLLELIFIQMVSLQKDGVEVKMSKRKGDIVNVDELLEEVGNDALRFFLIDSQANNRMVFDLELAKKQDKDNPVYYIQYAHARAASILRNLSSAKINIETKEEEAPELSEAELQDLEKTIFTKPNEILQAFSGESVDEDSLQTIRTLILELIEFPNVIEDAAEIRAPYKVSVYLKNLASLFHQFYNENRIIGVSEELMKARLSIALASKTVIANALRLLGISAPEKM